MILPSIPARFVRHDVATEGLLPPTWQTQILDAVRKAARPAQLHGDHPSSLEPDGTVVEYELVDGVEVATSLPWLDELYRTKFLSLASEAYGVPLMPSDSILNGVNVNVLRGRGSRYELHVDTNPLTGLLFVSSHDEGDGGELVFRGAFDDVVCKPHAGHLLLFDARNAPHHVSPMQRQSVRISVPMNYFTQEALAARPQTLDHYLYRQR